MDTQTRSGREAKRVLDEHRELQELLKKLQEFVQAPRPEVGVKGSHSWAADLSKKLTHLHDKLFLHFRNEERSGIFEDIKDQHPWASDKVDEMVAEHPVILEELRKLVRSTLTYSQGNVPRDPQLRTRLENLIRLLSHHEEQETDLILCLRNEDMGEVD